MNGKVVLYTGYVRMGVCPRKRIPLPDLRILEDFMVMDEYAFNDYVVIKALEDGVNIIGLTRGITPRSLMLARCI